MCVGHRPLSGLPKDDAGHLLLEWCWEPQGRPEKAPPEPAAPPRRVSPAKLEAQRDLFA